MSIPTFVTERLILQGVTEKDAPCYERYFVDDDIISQLHAGVPWPYPPGGVLTFLQQVLPQQGHTRWIWGLFLKDNPSDLIGAIDLRRQGKPENRGFWLGKPFWGQGYMTEATNVITDYAFDHLGFEKLILSNALANQRSHRIKEKAGAQLLYIAPKKFINPAYTACEVWELTPQNWKARKQKNY